MKAENLKHDEFFRKVMENPNVAKEFFEAHLPAEVREVVNINSLKLEKESFIEENLKRSISDVLFSSKINDRDGYLYLLVEHQSSSDHFMAFRLLRYMINIWARYLETNKNAKYLPLIYPMIFYNGVTPYTAPCNIWSLFENKNLAKNIWISDYKLINVHNIPDSELKKRVWSGVAEFFLKHIHEDNLLNRWQEIGDILPKFNNSNIGYDYMQTLLYYTLTKIDQDDTINLKALFVQQLNKEKGEKLMTSFAQHWEEQGIEKGHQKGLHEGRQKGLHEGLEKTAYNMLKQNLDVNLISKVTGLSNSEIIKLKNKNIF